MIYARLQLLILMCICIAMRSHLRLLGRRLPDIRILISCIEYRILEYTIQVARLSAHHQSTRIHTDIFSFFKAMLNFGYIFTYYQAYIV